MEGLTLQAAGKWQYYSAIALASLPDGVGIPALAQMAEADEFETTMALQLLAQLSGKHNQAQLILLSRASTERFLVLQTHLRINSR